jgi:hypothetical protein
MREVYCQKYLTKIHTRILDGTHEVKIEVITAVIIKIS